MTVYADGQTFYEVKWKGYKATTYEPATNPDIGRLVDEMNSKPQKKGKKQRVVRN